MPSFSVANAREVVLTQFYHSNNFSVDFQFIVMFIWTRYKLEYLADEDGEMLRMRLLRRAQLMYTRLPKEQLYSLFTLVHQQCFFFSLKHPFHEAEFGGKPSCQPFSSCKKAKRLPKTYKNSCPASCPPAGWEKKNFSCVEKNTERIICSQVPRGKKDHEAELLAAAKWQIPVQELGMPGWAGENTKP